MERKRMIWKTKGMNQDLSVSAFNPEFAFENWNLRLSTAESNTLMSWVSERGTLKMELYSPSGNTEGTTESTIEGTAIGTAVINHQLVVFTTGADVSSGTNGSNGSSGSSSTGPDNIYVLTVKDATSMNVSRIYSGYLGFKVAHPLETLVSYESDSIQKVYWVDGLNQPRLINIAPDNGSYPSYTTGGDSSNPDTQFNFVPSINGFGSIGVIKNISGGGTFAPGVIQYCYTLVNKFGQQTNILRQSSLHYLAFADRGANPEEKVSCSFAITIKDVDSRFQYVRLYSIQRTSLNAEPIVKQLEDLDIVKVTTTNNGAETTTYKASYTDNGTAGAIIDPTELLYVGGKEIIAGTIADKDSTLFLGDITEVNSDISNIQAYLREWASEAVFDVNVDDKDLKHIKASGVYSYKNQIAASKTLSDIAYFKAGQTYRLGIQLQKKTGEWSEPIFLKDFSHNTYPVYDSENAEFSIPIIEAALPLYSYKDYKSVRPIVVYPTISDREVLCQGVLNPTVFNALDRLDNSPFAQASWFFRPFVKTYNEETATSPTIVYPPKQGSTTTTLTKTLIDSINRYNRDVASNGKAVYVLTGELTDTNLNFIKARGNVLINETVTKYNYRTETVIKKRRREDVDDNTIRDVIEPGWEGQSETRMATHLLYGIIELGKTIRHNVTFYHCAFLSEDYWPHEVEDNSHYNSSYGLEDKNFFNALSYPEIEGKTASTSGTTFYINKSDVVADKDKLLYYVKDSSTYTFKFYDENSGYEIIFPSNARQADGAAITGVNGSRLPFRHLESLTTTENLGFTNSKDYTAYYDEYSKTLEIQGAVKSIITNASNETIKIDRESNTQFFVDQNIVTLNSPDLEFDTELQNTSIYDVTLKIVGAIPIKGYASSHKITLGSNMLEASEDDKEHRFGSGEVNANVTYSVESGTIANRLVSEYLWDDVGVEIKEDKVTTGHAGMKFMVYPWQRTGSLNNDTRPVSTASSVLGTKKISHLLFSDYSIYDDTISDSTSTISGTHAVIHLTENEFITNYRLPGTFDGSSGLNYYPNIDKVLYNNKGYSILQKFYNINNDGKYTPGQVAGYYNPVSMKYKSTTHAVLGLPNGTILPYPENRGTVDNDTFNSNKYSGSKYTPKNINSYLLIGELRRTVASPFGGTSAEAIRANKWEVCGDAVNIRHGNADKTSVAWSGGDTYYQRYDCLKTYAYTPEDTNQIVEILSFMCETHVNIDGRYDRNRGQLDNTNMSPKNFNLLNPVYSQHDNFFPIKKGSDDGNKGHHYPNWVVYSKTKTSGADTDLWTNVTLSSALELDGDKGGITSLQRFNDQIIAFQDKGISQILYNENVQIQSTAGVPIEIANSGKVQGKRYLSNTVGCHNKWSIVQTPAGIYFMDSDDKSIYLFNGQLQNISLQHGFDSWCKRHISGSAIWNPGDYGLGNNIGEGAFVGYYDRKNQDVLYVNTDYSLAFNEKIGAFTSFYEYSGNLGATHLCNLDDRLFWLQNTEEEIKNSSDTKKLTSLWGHQENSDYCNFFGKGYGYSMTLVGNPEPQRDKIFTNLEFRAHSRRCDNAGNPLPFDGLEVWNEYQSGNTYLSQKSGHDLFKHHTNDGISTLKRKFRIWRCDIPRDSIFRNDRMRNPWLYLKLWKDVEKKTTDSEKPVVMNKLSLPLHPNAYIVSDTSNIDAWKRIRFDHSIKSTNYIMFLDHNTDINDDALERYIGTAIQIKTLKGKSSHDFTSSEIQTIKENSTNHYIVFVFAESLGTIQLLAGASTSTDIGVITEIHDICMDYFT